jgi:SSS family solute:Na+ symporter
MELMKDSLNGFFFQYADLNFLHFAFLLFLVCTLVLIVVSYLTSKPLTQKIEGLTVHTTTKEIKDVDRTWRRRDLILSILLIVLVGVVWVYFSG